MAPAPPKENPPGGSAVVGAPGCTGREEGRGTEGGYEGEMRDAQSETQFSPVQQVYPALGSMRECAWDSALHPKPFFYKKN